MIDELPAAPDPAIDTPTVFSTKAAAMVLAQRKMIPQINTALANLSTFAAGGALTIPYEFGTSAEIGTTGGFLAVPNPGAQSSATDIYLDFMASGGKIVSSQLAQITQSTSANKGYLRVQKAGDTSKFMVFSVSSKNDAANYTVVHGAVIDSSETNPFTDGDLLLLFIQRTGDRGALGQGFQNIVVILSTQTWQPPTGITKAEITLTNGGYSGGTTTSAGTASGGKGGDSGVSIVTVDPAVTYTATVGAGGVGPGSNTTISPQAGGVSSFSGSGMTTLTTANATLKIPGWAPLTTTNASFGGGSLYASFSAGSATDYGGGGAGIGGGNIGWNGKSGLVVIRY